jgi:hypothetical protein
MVTIEKDEISGCTEKENSCPRYEFKVSEGRRWTMELVSYAFFV